MHSFSRFAPLVLLALFLGAPSALAAVEPVPLQLVESFPVETTLDTPDIPEAWQVWIEMFDSAKSTIDLSHFYSSSEPGSRLEPVIASLERAAKRGVRLRLLFDKGFYERTYKEPIDSFRKWPGTTVRLIDFAALGGGVQHAKYFLVDGREGYLGSQNFDWRALDQIQELGVRMRTAPLVRPLSDVFETDWAIAGGAPRETRKASGDWSVFADAGGRTRARFVASPAGWLPDEKLWDLPELVRLLDGAKKTVRVQVLTYGAVDRNHEYFPELETALRRAAARGVAVELLVADWSRREPLLSGIRSLEALPGIEVRTMSIPEASRGFVPFSRTVHAKYLVVDGERGWVGTSNWEGDYFRKSRNVGVLLEGGEIPARLDRFFERNWSSPYAQQLDLCRAYPPPAVGEKPKEK
jgi:phosphatidylserine/phosphatidylglycerophosphate/cardiolipin synthase-like enzyme